MEFNQWRQDDAFFVETKAFNEVENKTNQHNWVIVEGHSGSGKTAIIQHIAIKYKNEGWNVKPLHDAQGLIDTYYRRKKFQKKHYSFSMILLVKSPLMKYYITYGLQIWTPWSTV